MENIVEQTLAEAFPQADPGAKPVGGRVLVQFRQAKKKVSAGGIILPEETRETEKFQNMIAKVVSLGPLAFKKRDTMEPWPEGTWANPGDFVRVPRYTADRWEVKVPGSDEPVLFGILNDVEIIAVVTGDPLAFKAFV